MCTPNLSLHCHCDFIPLHSVIKVFLCPCGTPLLSTFSPCLCNTWHAGSYFDYQNFKRIFYPVSFNLSFRICIFSVALILFFFAAHLHKSLLVRKCSCWVAFFALCKSLYKATYVIPMLFFFPMNKLCGACNIREWLRPGEEEFVQRFDPSSSLDTIGFFIAKFSVGSKDVWLREECNFSEMETDRAV